MAPTASDFDPYVGDPRRYGFSLAQLAELILPCLEAVGARAVAEVGAYAGDLTRVLLDWAAAGAPGTRITAIDPAPQEPLVQLAERSTALDLIRQPGQVALQELPLPDVVILDGDHNYFTVSNEVRVLDARASANQLPLLLLHDVWWPHGRRDDYFEPRLIPDEDRHPMVGEHGGLFPGDPGVHPGGLPYPRSAAHEGGPRNGVLTAVEDFVAPRPHLRLAVVPAFFGLGAVWHRDSPAAPALEEILAPWDRNPILERLEHGRVNHLAESHQRQVSLWTAQARQARQEATLRRLLDSSAFAVAERLSRLRVRAGVARAEPPVAKEEIRRALEHEPPSRAVASD